MQLSGNIFDYVVVFWSGVLVSFTPCVYPVLPLTASFIASANTNGTKFKGFILSLIYVLGMALTYCALAVFASMTGKIFGQFQNSPVMYTLTAGFLILFALVMIDVIKMPNWGGGLQQKIKIKNVWSVLLFGAVSGFVIGPCTAPILGTLLLYIGSKQNVLHGASLMFVFSYGVGASLILVGTFSGLLSSLPKSGPWLVNIKRIAAFILICAALYFLYQAGTNANF